jgi:hypothetical protein
VAAFVAAAFLAAGFLAQFDLPPGILQARDEFRNKVYIRGAELGKITQIRS